MATLIDKVYSLNIGVQGENIARAIELDMTEWVAAYPEASFYVLFRPYNESEAVPMLSTFENNILTWTPTLSATAVSGVGYTEIRALDPETGLIRKSRIIPTSVENSVTGADENPPQPYADWVNRVLEAGSDAVKGAAAVAAVSQGEEVAFEIDDDGHLNIVYTESGEPQTLDLGPVDAYAIAVAEGYTGTREEWVQAMADAEANGLKAEGYAIGKQNGVAVESGEYYQNNAKYYNEQAQSAKEDAEAAQTAAETAQTAAETAKTSAAASAADALEHTQSVIETWLGNNIDPDSGYALDRTLAISTAAAPADTVGDLKSAIEANENTGHSGMKYVGMKFASKNTTISGDVGGIAVYHMNPYDKVKIVIHADTDKKVARDGIGLTNDPVPNVGDTIERVGETHAITTDTTIEFINYNGYKYCYVYYSTIGNNSVNAEDPNRYIEFTTTNDILNDAIAVNTEDDIDNLMNEKTIIRQGTASQGLNITSGTVASGSKQKLMTYRVPQNTFVQVDGFSAAGNRCCIGLGNKQNIEIGDTLDIAVPTVTVSSDYTVSVYTKDYNYLTLYYATGGGLALTPPAEISFPKKTVTRSEYIASQTDGKIISNKITSLVIGNLSSGSLVVPGDGKRVISNVMTFPVGSTVIVKTPEGYYANLAQYTDDGTYKASYYSSWQTVTETPFVINYPKNRLIIKRSDSAAFGSIGELDGLILYEYPAVRDFSNGRYYGKRISILGDSLSTYGGNYDDSYNNKRFSPTGNIYNYPGNQCRYPENALSVFDPHQMYWMQAIDSLGMTLGINESWARSRVSWDGVEDTEKITVDGVEYWANPFGADRYIASQTRINHLGGNGTPDIVLVNAGTNDAGNNVTIGTVNYESPQGYTAEQIAALPVDTFADAYRTMLIRLMYTYPNAKIICMTPSFRSGNYAVQKLDQYIEIIKEICDMFGIPLIDTRHSGVSILESTSAGYLPDGTHYNGAGMKMVGELLIRKLLFEV